MVKSYQCNFKEYPLHYQTIGAEWRMRKMFYTQVATSLAPALVVYLIDASYSIAISTATQLK